MSMEGVMQAAFVQVPKPQGGIQRTRQQPPAQEPGDMSPPQARRLGMFRSAVHRAAGCCEACWMQC